MSFNIRQDSQEVELNCRGRPRLRIDHRGERRRGLRSPSPEGRPRSPPRTPLREDPDRASKGRSDRSKELSRDDKVGIQALIDFSGLTMKEIAVRTSYTYRQVQHASEVQAETLFSPVISLSA
ncbi:hypothetical protein H9Q69_014324 [Fusarium xylarioides]|nr:hypothetical protein H9Q69_014324 [Fusarium xylarioides]